LPDVRRPDARSAQIGGPDAIRQRLQVSSYSSEPSAPIRARNLLANADCRTALGDEPSELRPQVSSVRLSEALAGD
jgi:hypothetical protein